jgi:hypothetical protein
MKAWSTRATLLALLSFGVVTTPGVLLAATPSNGTINPTAGSTANWTGSATAATNGESTCVDGTNCDVYTLNLSGSTTNYAGLYVTIQAKWSLSADEYDLYVHQGGLSGPVVASATQGPLIGSQTIQFSPAVTGAGVYTIHIVASAVTPNDPYSATATVGSTPPPPPTAKLKAPTYQDVHSPTGVGDNSGEPSIGQNWNSGNIMTNAVLDTLRVSFNTATSPASPTWTLVDSPITSTESLDPILFTDSLTGRTFVSQLAGTTSLAAYTDDDGATYSPSQGGGIASGVDHQTVGGGPSRQCTPLQAQLNPAPCAVLKARGPLTSYPHVFYYASQDVGDAAMALSQDGGLTFGPAVPMYTIAQCGGLHGHVKVGWDGTVFLPNKSCSGTQGLIVSQDNGLTFTVQSVTGSTPGTSDPSVGIGAKGRVYFGYVDSGSHPKITVSDDNGQSWHYNYDVGAAFGIQNTVFPEVVAGDNDRASFFFLGTPSAGPGTADDTAGIFSGVWHAYIATTIDGGKSWLTVDATPTDPVQLGVVCTNGTTCPSGTRNLLDFNDTGIDKYGRVYAAYTDGCISAACIAAGNSSTADHTKATNDGATKATLLRQGTGVGLFSQYDKPGLKP